NATIELVAGSTAVRCPAEGNPTSLEPKKPSSVELSTRCEGAERRRRQAATCGVTDRRARASTCCTPRVVRANGHSPGELRSAAGVGRAPWRAIAYVGGATRGI